VNGETSGELVDALRSPSSPETAAVQKADIDLVTIGANDFSGHYDSVTAGECLGDTRTECVTDELGRMERDIDQTIRAIHRLRGGRPTAVLVTGYWNVFKDGAVARRDYPDVGVRATQRLTGLVNDGVRAAADRAGATYVDLSVPFDGPRTGGDPTRLPGADGDHPNAAGQELIAARLLAAGLPGLAGS
jgi:lysophospholipase L1-like esterase